MSERTRQWIVRLYSLGLGLAGLIALAWASRSAGLPGQWLPLAYFLLLSFLVKYFGFRAAPEVTHSLGGVVDVAALLTLGTVAGGWVAALSSLLYSAYGARQRRLATARTILEVPLFNGGLKAFLALAGGALYQALGGTFAPAAFTWKLVGPLLVLCLTWAALDHLGWAIRQYLQGGRNGLIAWLRTVSTPSVLVELLPLPAAMAIALAHTLDLGSFVLLALATLSVSLIVRLLAEARQKLEARLAELTALNDEVAAKQRLAQELQVARDIQKRLLPSFCPLVPGFELAADWRSALEVSGDFYDFVPLAGSTLGLLIADVSGKGVPAALFMALSRSLVRSGVIGASSPSEGLRRANTWIIKDAQSDMFVTLFYGVLDPAARTLTYANAGHNRPLLYRAYTGAIEPLAAKGIALGMLPEIELEERQVTMAPGDLLVLYTDGVTEAINEHEEAFGEERLTQVVRQHHDLEAKEVITQIRAAMRAFTGERPRFDDATLVVLKCRGE